MRLIRLHSFFIYAIKEGITIAFSHKSGKITYAEAKFNARNKIYQSVKPDFNLNVEYMKDPLSRDIPPVDNSLFILARKLILEIR